MGFGYWSIQNRVLSREGFNRAQAAQMERLADQGGFTADSVVLDLGCGTGVNSFYLAQRFGCRVLGVDISSGF